MTENKSSAWLITGASSGIGKALALEALRAGHGVIGTTRDREKARESFPELLSNGGVWAQVDPADEKSTDAFAQLCRDHDVDVLVNSAGFAFIGGVEDTSENELRHQMEVNFYGPLRSIKACLPIMRSKSSGTIVLISSAAGFVARAARGSYSASKFAIEAIHESLAQEVETFGIKVLIVEPGAFRTPFAETIVTPSLYSLNSGVSDAYAGTVVEQMVLATRNIMSLPGVVKGDPRKAAKAIISAVDQGGFEFLRLPLGPDCVGAMERKIQHLQKDLDSTRSVSMGTDLD